MKSATKPTNEFKPAVLCCLFVWALCTQPARAGFLPDVPPPTAPWVADLPNKARWLTVLVQALPQTIEEGKPEKPSGTKIESILWNTLKTDTIHRGNAEPVTLIYYSGFVVVDGLTSSGKRAPVLAQQAQGTDYSNLRSTGWLGTEWVGEKTFLGAEAYQRRVTKGQGGGVEEICYLYRRPADTTQEETYYPEVKAWIRVSDKVPVAVSIDGVIFEIEVQPPPLQPPPMSSEQSAKLLEIKDRNDRMMRLKQRSTSSRSQ
jgi:hypothetical protein